MSEESNINIRLSKAAKEFNVGRETIVEFLTKKGFQIDPSPNTKLTSEMYALLVKEYQGEREVKNEAKKLGDLSYKGGSVSVDSTVQSSAKDKDEDDNEEVFIRTSTIVKDTQPKEVKTEKPKEKETPKPVAPAEPIEEAFRRGRPGFRLRSAVRPGHAGKGQRGSLQVRFHDALLARGHPYFHHDRGGGRRFGFRAFP